MITFNYFTQYSSKFIHFISFLFPNFQHPTTYKLYNTIKQKVDNRSGIPRSILFSDYSNPSRQYTSKMPASSIFSWGVRTRQSLRLPAIRRSLPLFHIMLYARIPDGVTPQETHLHTPPRGHRGRGRDSPRDRC